MNFIHTATEQFYIFFFFFEHHCINRYVAYQYFCDQNSKVLINDKNNSLFFFFLYVCPIYGPVSIFYYAFPEIRSYTAI